MKNAAYLFKILSGDKRIEIIEFLKKESMSVNIIADALGVTQSAASQHLRVLKSAGYGLLELCRNRKVAEEHKELYLIVV